MPELRLSYSSMQRYFEGQCPAAWDYARKYEPNNLGQQTLEIDYTAANRGTLVHSMLEGKTDPASVTDQAAINFYRKLYALREELGIRVLETEIWRSFRLAPGIRWSGRIDARAELPSGEKVLIDYKSTGSAWETVPAKKTPVAPQAYSFQGIGYLIREPGQKGHWPKKVLFLIAGYRGAPIMQQYDYDAKDEANLRAAAASIKMLDNKGAFPKVRGKACYKCPFRAVCYEAPGWQDLYHVKGTGKEKSE